MKTFLRAFILTLSIAWLSASSAFALPKILILGAEQPTWIADIQTNLVNTGQFAQVDYQAVPSYGGTFPTLAALQAYGAVMIFGDYGMGAGEGSVLASYVDGGGGVVVATFSLSETVLDASFNNSTYQCMVPGAESSGQVTLGTVSMPSHPIMKNVSSINGGTSSYRGSSTTLAGNAYIIAKWSDGTLLVVAREGVGANSKARRVDLNMFPVSSNIRSDFWQTSSNGALLMANAMTWAAGGGAPPSELNLTPKSISFGSVPPGSPVTNCITAQSVGAANLHITGIALAGPTDFTISSGTHVGDSILVGTSKQFCITFNPTAAGTRTATFTLTTDGRDSGTQSVTLTGNGILPAVAYGATTLFHQIATELTDTSATKYVTVSSVGLGPLIISNIFFIGLNANSYYVVHSPPGTMQPGTTDSIGVRFTPTIEGRPDASLVINTNTLNNPSDTIPLFGLGVLPRLVINNTYFAKPSGPATSGTTFATTINDTFGNVNVGADSCKFISLYNPGSDTLAISRNFFSSADYDFTLHPLTGNDTLIPPGGTQQIQVCFAPIKQGTRTATLRITTDIPHTFDVPPHDTSGFSVVITGIGVPFGHLAVTGPAIEDTTPVGVQKCMVDTLWNTGQADLTVTKAMISGADSSEFSFTGLTFPLPMAANTFVTFNVCATPTTDGNSSVVFTAIATSGSEGTIDTLTATLPLGIFGTKICSTLAWVTNFPLTTCVGTVDTATMTVTNCGNVMTQYMASIAGTNSAQFAVVGSNTSAPEGSGGVATFMITYTPDATIPSSIATLNITGGVPGSLQLSAALGTATIAGTGTAPTTDVGATSAPFAATVTNSGGCDWNPGTPVVTAPFAYSSGSASISGSGGTGSPMFTFTPTAPGTVTQTVQFPSAVGATSAAPVVTLTGTAGTDLVPILSAKDGYSIDQNYPNPFSNKSEVEITLANPGLVHLAILDITGQVVENVMDQTEEGSFTVRFDASELASGTYFYTMTCNGVTLTRQMSILK